MTPDTSFVFNQALALAVEHLSKHKQVPTDRVFGADALPTKGLGELATMELLAPHVLGQSADLGHASALAHMDPPTPWITWATALWNASLNQNLLHPSTSPFAKQAETLVIDWLAPYFGMQGGHMCSGSTLANLTALWAARDTKGVRKVVASSASHISIAKAANILGLHYIAVDTLKNGRLNTSTLPDLQDACLVLNAGTTASGVVDDLEASEYTTAAWKHIDAAWAGPLRLSQTHKHILKGINTADSVAVSAHKWLFQPKDSAFVLFKDLDASNQAISMGSDYLATPNVGIQGSRGAPAVCLLATLIAWGELGFAQRIDLNMQNAWELADWVDKHPSFELWQPPQTGVNVFRHVSTPVPEILTSLPQGMLSSCSINGQNWLRSVSLNPNVDMQLVFAHLDANS